MKNNILLFLLLIPVFLFAQYPTQGNKSRLGYQTTGDGLIWRGVAADTSYKPIGLNYPYFQLDTVNGILRRYIKTRARWQSVGAIDSLVYATRYWVNSNFFPLEGGTLTGTGGAGFIGFPSQVSAPGTPASGLNVYAQGSSFNWKGTDGYERQFASTLTGGRTYTLPNVSGTFALGTGTATRIPIWTSTNVLGDSPILYNSTTKRTTWDSPGIIELPMGTDAQRPTATTSDFWYNTTGNGIEWYNGSRWAKGLESTFNRGTATRVPFFDANGQITDNSKFNFEVVSGTGTFWFGDKPDGANSFVYTNSMALKNYITLGGATRIGSEVITTTGSTGIYKNTTAGDYIFRAGKDNSTIYFSVSGTGGVSFDSLVTNNGGSVNFLSTGNYFPLQTSTRQPTSFGSPKHFVIRNTYYDVSGRTSLVRYQSGTTSQAQAYAGLVTTNAGGNSAWIIGTVDGATSYSEKFRVTDIGNIRLRQEQGAATILHGSNAISGTNNAGGSLTIASGEGTGNATATDLIFQTPTAGASGTTAQTLTSRWWIKGGTGRLGNSSTLNYLFDISTSTDALGIARGTVAQRPTISSSTTPFRFNTDSTALEYGESVGTWQQIATRAYARSLVSALPTTNIYTSNGSLSSDRVLTGGAFDLRLQTDVTIGDSLKVATLPNHTAPDSIVTTKGGWLGKKRFLMDGANRNIIGFSNSGFFDEGGYRGFQSGSATKYNVLSQDSTGVTRIQSVYGSRLGQLIISDISTNPSAFISTMVGVYGMGVQSKPDFVRFFLDGGSNIRGNATVLNVDSTGTLLLTRYGTGTKKTATLLSKTQSNYIAGFATDGTVLDLERKRDTTVYVVDTDLDWSAAITTAQVASRFNRVIFLMTTTGAAGSNSDLTLHTPDINLMQVEYLIRSTDEAGGFTNTIQFGSNNAVQSDNTLTGTYTPAAGQGVGIRAGLRSGTYKYWYY